MAVSIVNGFMCFSSCDVAKAEKGVNPHPKLDASGQVERFDASGQRIKSGSATNGPAVVYGGSLASQATSQANESASTGTATGGASAPSQSYSFQAFA
jgi:hypothetical protein